MIRQLGEIDRKYVGRLKDYEVKEKEHVDWIHHLEAKLKERKNKRKTAIDRVSQQVIECFKLIQYLKRSK